MLTVERLRELLSYDPKTGAFTWLVANSRRVKVGEVAGCVCKTYGYRIIGIDGRVYRAGRLAWLYMTGMWPAAEIDHENRDRLDDRFANLREAVRGEQQCNRSKQKNNTSGFKGVHFHPETGKWRARISKNKASISLGLYETPQKAHAAYVKAAERTHGVFTSER